MEMAPGNMSFESEVLMSNVMESARWRRAGAGGEDDCGRVELNLRLGTGSPPPAPAAEGERKNLTIFYNQRVCAVDVTELQARAIISLANRHMEQNKDKVRMAPYHEHYKQIVQRAHHATLPPASPDGLGSPAAPFIAHSGLSMKRSLQRFLQKRKTRVAAVSPYFGRPARRR